MQELPRRNVLDHGYVILRNVSGPTRRADGRFDAFDVDPANAARMSFNQMDSGRTFDDEMRLTRFLHRESHSVPFEHVECWFEMKLPIFVARQLVKARTTSISEISGRYVKMPEEWHIPSDVMMAPADKRQGGVDLASPELAAAFTKALNDQCSESYRKYLLWRDWGVSTEDCRNFLHVNHYTVWLYKQDFRNLCHMLRLRDHEGAQKQTREYAVAIRSILDEVLPELLQVALGNPHAE